VNPREEVLARTAAAHNAATPPNLRYEGISREYRTTSDSPTAELSELLIDRLVDYRALVPHCGRPSGFGPVLDGRPFRQRAYRWAQ
jgi:hypothetical protein